MEKAKILLVDDEVAFTNTLSKLLKGKGFYVTAVNNGESAIRALEDDRFDVVVLDLKMPGMDGISTLKKIKKLGLLTETLILTGHGSIDTAFKTIELGAYEYLSKPCSVGELVDKIESAKGKKDGEEKKDMLDQMIRIKSHT